MREKQVFRDRWVQLTLQRLVTQCIERIMWNCVFLIVKCWVNCVNNRFCVYSGDNKFVFMYISRCSFLRTLGIPTYFFLWLGCIFVYNYILIFYKKLCWKCITLPWRPHTWRPHMMTPSHMTLTYDDAQQEAHLTPTYLQYYGHQKCDVLCCMRARA